MFKSVFDDSLCRWAIFMFVFLCCTAFCLRYLVILKREYSDHNNLLLASNIPVRDIRKDVQVRNYLSKHNVYLSFTTSPDRIFNIEKILNILDLTNVNKVYLHVPIEFARTGRRYVIPDSLEKFEKLLIIRHIQDSGPITKLLPTVKMVKKNDPDALIITMDDDYIYPPNMVNEHIFALVKNEKVVTNTMIARLGSVFNMPFSYYVDAPKLAGFWPNKNPSIVQGVGSIGFVAKDIDENQIESFLKKEKGQFMHNCFFSDDLLISYIFAKKGVSFHMISNKYLSHDLLSPLLVNSFSSPLSEPFNDPYGIYSFLGYDTRNPIQVRLEHCFDFIINNES